jgi:hypothetical protein
MARAVHRLLNSSAFDYVIDKIYVEMPGIEPGTFHMQSGRSTTELHPHRHMVSIKGKYTSVASVCRRRSINQWLATYFVLSMRFVASVFHTAVGQIAQLDR